MKNLIHFLLGNGHATSLIGYCLSVMQLHDGGTSWHNVLKTAGMALLGRLVDGGSLPGLPVK